MGARGAIFFLFLDGVGIGRRGGPENPFTAARLPGFEALLGGPMLTLEDPGRSGPHLSARPIDATLGVDGLPQSGTGQAAILTGENAAGMLGRHFGPYPHTSLRPLIERSNFFARLEASGISAMYLNAFPAQYRDHVARHPGRTGAFSLAWRSGGRPLNGADELVAGRALSSDCTAEAWAGLGYPEVRPVTPAGAARIALRMLEERRFVLFEYYLTDHAGHGRSKASPADVLRVLDSFLAGFLEGFDRLRDTLIVTSDHGNFEDLSTTAHTRNPVPFIAAGRGHERLASSVRDLTGIAPAILDHFGRGTGGEVDRAR